MEASVADYFKFNVVAATFINEYCIKQKIIEHSIEIVVTTFQSTVTLVSNFHYSVINLES